MALPCFADMALPCFADMVLPCFADMALPCFADMVLTCFADMAVRCFADTAQAPHIMILDEPTNHLDMESVEALIDGLNAFEGGVVLVSHDARLIARTDCELWVCNGDRKITVDKLGFAHYKQQVKHNMWNIISASL
eukprot:248174-Prorocentrum_minimum.AAC.1